MTRACSSDFINAIERWKETPTVRREIARAAKDQISYATMLAATCVLLLEPTPEATEALRQIRLERGENVD